MKMGITDLDNLKGTKYESEEDCLLREQRELDVAVSIASQKNILSAMDGEINNIVRTQNQFVDTL